MQTKTSRNETQESITECLGEYRKLLQREKRGLIDNLKCTSSVDAVAVHRRIGEIDEELRNLNAGDIEIDF